MIEIESHISHGLGKVTAAKRLQEFMSTLPQRFPQQVHQVSVQVQDDWLEIHFAAYGYLVQWRADVEENCIVLHGRLPDSARKFKNKMQQAVVHRLNDALHSDAGQRRAA